MTKKKKLLNGIIFLVGLVVFLIYYLEDTGDMKEVEKKQDKEAPIVADSIADVLNASFDDEDFEQDSAMAEVDSVVVDSL